MNNAKTPLEDLRKDALDHYIEASSAIHHWNSSVPQAINYYFDKMIQKENSHQPVGEIKYKEVKIRTPLLHLACFFCGVGIASTAYVILTKLFFN